MKNQHKEIELMNRVKEKGIELGELIGELYANTDTDKRWVAIAKTDLQKGIMFAVRSIAKPETF